MVNLEKDLSEVERLHVTKHYCENELADITGSLEAITEALDTPETVELTEHQRDSVTAFKNISKDSKEPVYAVIDTAALESFTDMTYGLAKKAATSSVAGIKVKYAHTAKLLRYYAKIAGTLHARLEELKPLLKAREYPVVEYFDYGSFSRFFQVNGKSIGDFTTFNTVVEQQLSATHYVFQAASSYVGPLNQKLLTSLQQIQSVGKAQPELLVELRDSVERHWLQTWKEADLVPNKGQTPQSALQAFPNAKFTSLVPLLDNRYLVACQPKSNGGNDANRVVDAIYNYRVAVAFDKTKVPNPQASINLPNCRDLLLLVDQVLVQLNDFKEMELLAKQNDKGAREFERVSNIVLKHKPTENELQYYGFLAQYFKILGAAANSSQEPYIEMCWLFIRTALVITSFVELSVLVEQDKRQVTKRFTTKHGENFPAPALESYIGTQKALQAARAMLNSK